MEYRFSVLSDVHLKFDRLEREVARAKAQERNILCAGDYLKYHLRPGRKKIQKQFEQTLSTLDTLGENRVFLTHGNHDPQESFRTALEASGRNLSYIHAERTARIPSAVKPGGLEIIGFGGTERLEGMSFLSGIPFVSLLADASTYSYEEIYSSLKKNLETRKTKLSDTVVLAHQVPYGTLDQSRWDKYGRKLPGVKFRYGGANAVRDALNEYSPMLVVGGHVHEDPGIAVREECGKSPMCARYSKKSGGALDFSQLDRERLNAGGVEVVESSKDSVTFGINKFNHHGLKDRPTFYLNPGSLGYSDIHCDVNVKDAVPGSNAGFDRELTFKFYNGKA